MYDPSVVSLGPYHHGATHLLELEHFKDEVVNDMLKADDAHATFRGKILERMEEIRHFYGGVSPDRYDDNALAGMMLRDACFLLYCVELYAAAEGHREARFMLLFRHLGIFQGSLMVSDCFKLENQIPRWILKSLVSLTYDDEKELLRRFLSLKTCGNFAGLKHLPWENDDDDDDDHHPQPLHILEALRNTRLYNREEMEMSLDRLQKMVINSKMKLETESEAGSSEGIILQLRRRPFLSVTELKKKGVYVKAGSTFLFDIRFTSYYFFGVLHLPVLTVSSTVLFNMMALEMAPGTRCVDSVVTSYLNLMKSLIDDAKDVKELQEKGIIVSMAEDNNEIVRMLKDMGSYGIEVLPVFDEIKMRINDHCNSKANTWIADLINSYLRSPWTVIALAATILLLCLTFLQTIYTITPTNH